MSTKSGGFTCSHCKRTGMVTITDYRLANVTRVNLKVEPGEDCLAPGENSMISADPAIVLDYDGIAEQVGFAAGVKCLEKSKERTEGDEGPIIQKAAQEKFPGVLVKITVEGKQGSGKSRVSMALARSCKLLGVDCYIKERQL